MLQPHLWSSLRPVTSAHSKFPPLTPPALHHCLAEAVVINFYTVGVAPAKVSCIVSQPAAAAMRSRPSKRFRCQLRNRWVPPRQPVRCSGSATTHMCALSHLVLSARCAGPFSRPPSIHPTIKGSQVTYCSACTRWYTSRWRAWSFKGSRSPRSRRKHLACEGHSVYVCAYSSSGPLWR